MGADHDAVGVDEVDGAVGLELAVEEGGVGAEHAVEDGAVDARLDEAREVAGVDGEIFPVDDGGAGELLDGAGVALLTEGDLAGDDLMMIAGVAREGAFAMLTCEPGPDMAPIQFAETPGIVRAQLKLPQEKTDCTIGEKVWGGRGYYGGFGRQ